MLISDLIVEVRDESLARVGIIMPEDLVGLEAVLRFNAVGGWKLTLRADHPLADALRAPGAGIIITGPTGVLLSGSTVTAKNVKTAEDPTGVWEIQGTDDSAILSQRVAYPTPASADVSAQGDYDVRTGKAETVAKAYVKANIGADAPTARRVTGLAVEADSARGVTVTGRARFDALDKLLGQVLATSGLGYTIEQAGNGLEFQIFSPVDRTDSVRMDIDNNRLTKSEYSYSRPQATRVIVAGQGAGAERTLVERSTSDSVTAETAWNARIEVFKDQRNTNDVAELQQAGDELLAEKGLTIESVSVTPTDDDTMAYGIDWGLGDKVSVVVGDSQISQIVTEVAIVVTDEGVKVGATVGNPVAGVKDDVESQVIATQSSQDERISNLERNETGGGSSGGSLYNLDAGVPNTNYGGSDPIDAGGI